MNAPSANNSGHSNPHAGTPDVSANRQQQVVRELQQLIAQRDQRRSELEQQWQSQSAELKQSFAAQRQTVSRDTLIRHDALEADYQAQLATARESAEAQHKMVQVELEEKLDSNQKQAATELSDGEYDWFLAKKRAQKDHQTDVQESRELYKQHKAKLKAHGAAYSNTAANTKASLARHNCELVAQGGDLLEEPDDSDHLTAHQQTHARVQELTRQFQHSFWVRFIEHRSFLIVFLVATLGAAYPLTVTLRHPLLALVSTLATGTVLTFVAWWIGRSLAAKTAQQFKTSFETALVSGKHQLLAAQHQNKRRRDAKLARLESQFTQRIAELDQQWADLQARTNTRKTQRHTELTTWGEKRTQLIQQQLTEQQQRLAGQFGPRLNELQTQLASAKVQLDRAESEQFSSARAAYEAGFQQLAESWKQGLQSLHTEAESMQQTCRQSPADLRQPNLDQWQPPAAPAAAVTFGQLELSLKQMQGDDQEDRRLHSDVSSLCLPASLDLTRSPSLLVEPTCPAAATQTLSLMRDLMIRFLLGTPPGKLQFTIIDPVGLGQSFSAFMHLVDHDEHLINHRIWTETAHIQARLTDLTKHMENVIQTYLRNEYPTIQAYNQQAGEVAEAFRVLVVANFPHGFSDEAASRLQSIISSGPRCGVFTLISVDRTQSLPRNFDLDAIRQQMNVVIVDEDDVRWADAPLNEYPITVPDTPDEETTSQIMHCVGRLAKQANRVEVPFSAVAPVADQWWQADSRSGVRAALGRAGATKLQDLQLGHGTSQHVLISGKTGSGKSTLLHAMITNLALRYSPQELQFYLIDFKKGVEFKAYAEYGLPHARVIAIESEREFGQSVLQRLDAELRRRGDLFRQVGVQSIAGYRDARPDEPMPRVMLVIDEFQEFFVKEDKIAQDANLLLDRLVRQGRAFGIHVLLGSQTLAGAYSLARATLGQMAVRVALQCSSADAHLILSDDNDAARLLRRPGDAIYNDANGMVEGNHPFQVVWLGDVEKETYLRQLAQRDQASPRPSEPAIVFEGNVAADLAQNQLLNNAWTSPAPEGIPLAPRAWLGEAVAIKDPPAAVFHRRNGSNLLLVGQQEESALAIMAGTVLSLAAFSPTDAETRSRFVVFDGLRPESPVAGYWQQFQQTTELSVELVKQREAVEQLAELYGELQRRQGTEPTESKGFAAPTFGNSFDQPVGESTTEPPTNAAGQTDARPQSDGEPNSIYVLVHNLSRFRELQKSDEDFGFGSRFGEDKKTSPAEMLAALFRDGPQHGMHVIVWCDTQTNLSRWLDRQSLRDMEMRVLFQMSASDSSNLMDSSAAAQLGPYRAIFYSEDQGRAERFRPYGLPDDDHLLRIRSLARERQADGKPERSFE